MIILFLSITFNIILVSGNVMKKFSIKFVVQLVLYLTAISLCSAAFFYFNLINFSTGSPLSDQVHQTPAHMYNKPGETAKINCSHSIDTWNRILWYKQSNGQLQFLGNMVATGGFAEIGMGVKIEGSANKDQICTLTTEVLNLSSSAVYFCVASFHSATYHCSSVQKPHHSFLSLYYSSQPLCTWIKPF